MSSHPAPVLVTRPAREAGRWVQALREAGLPAEALPLIAISPAPDADALARRRAGLAACAAAMFVSANAVQGFLEAAGPAWPAGTRAWTTGPGTTQALLDGGVPPAQIDAPDVAAAQFDSEALWQRVRTQPLAGRRVLIVRGGDASGQAAGRDWLANQLEAAGAQVDTVVAYVRSLPSWDAAQRERARAGAADGSRWLLSSSEAIANLASLLPDQEWAAARAVCTHPRIAAAARDAGFGDVAQVAPLLGTVAAFLQSQA